jgi:hypothetical protein
MKVIRKEILITAIIIFVVLCLGVTALYTALVRPRALAMAGVKADLATRRSELQSLSPENMKDLLAKAQQCRSKLEEYVLLADRQGTLSTDLCKLGSDQGLSVISGAALAIANNNALYTNEQKMDLSFTGDYIGFARFVRALELNRPVVFVDGFKIAHDTENPGRVTGNINTSVVNEGKR